MKLKQLTPLLIDVLAPVILYYLLRAVGVHDGWALGAGALIPGVSTGSKLIRLRTLDQLGLFMTAMFILGTVLVFVTGDPRLILVKPALFVGAAGIFCFVSLTSKPFMMTIAKPMATEGDARLEALWEEAWVSSEPFQGVIKISTMVFGAALLVDAVGRIIIVYSVPVGTSVALANLPGLIAIIGAIVYHVKTVKPVFELIKKN